MIQRKEFSRRINSDRQQVFVKRETYFCMSVDHEGDCDFVHCLLLDSFCARAKISWIEGGDVSREIFLSIFPQTFSQSEKLRISMNRPANLQSDLVALHWNVEMQLKFMGRFLKFCQVMKKIAQINLTIKLISAHRISTRFSHFLTSKLIDLDPIPV